MSYAYRSVINDRNAKEIDTDMHVVDVQTLCSLLDTDLTIGLTKKQVLQRLAEDGPNVLTKKKTLFMPLRVVENMFSGFSPLLMIAAILCIMVYGFQHHNQTRYNSNPDNFYLFIALLVVILLTGLLTFKQNQRIPKIMKGFESMVPHYAVVRRDGIRYTILAADLVIGDLVSIRFGDRVPADLRIIESDHLKVDNSEVTGETEPQARNPNFTHVNPLETKNLVFYSTHVLEGTASGIVIACGDNTVIGRIARLSAGLVKTQSLFNKELQCIVYIMTVIIIILGSLFFLLWLPSAQIISDYCDCLIGIILANVPEGLLVTVTIYLVLTSRRLALKNCVVKNLEAIGTLGATSLICSDKTGILTQNRMIISHLWVNDTTMEADALTSAYNPDPDNHSRMLNALLLSAVLCNNAEFQSGQGDMPVLQKEISGNASETALLQFCEIIFENTAEIRRLHRKIVEIPFNSTDRFQLSIHELIDNDHSLFVLQMKGAPERIFDACSTIYIDNEDQPITLAVRKHFQEAYLQMGNCGERALGFSDYFMPVTGFPAGFQFTTEPNLNFPLSGFRFLGLISMIDPPRASVPEAVSKCREAGIKVIMVTGDHPITAKAIAKSVGIITRDTIEDAAERLNVNVHDVDPKTVTACIIHGLELTKLKPIQLDKLINEHEEIVFARTSPLQKLLIVESCQRNGEIVAVTGDSLNDAPALRKADVGVSMGISSSYVAQKAADIVLLDDSFATIVSGIEEGRRFFDNLKKVIAYTLTSNMPELAPFLFTILFNVPMPIWTISILCIDVCAEILPAISLAFERPEGDPMKRKPRDPNEDWLIDKRLITKAYLQIGIIQTLACLLSYFIIMAFYGFYPMTLIGLHKDWNNQNKQDVKDTFGQEWTYYERKHVEFICQMAYFITLMIVQLANLIMCKMRFNSIFQQGMRNHLLNFSMFITVAIILSLSFYPKSQMLFSSHTELVYYWLIPWPFVIIIFVYDEMRRYFIRKHPDSWFYRITYY